MKDVESSEASETIKRMFSTAQNSGKRDDYENTLAALQKRYLPPDLDKNEDWSPHSDELVADFFHAKIMMTNTFDGSLGQGTSKIDKRDRLMVFSI